MTEKRNKRACLPAFESFEQRITPASGANLFNPGGSIQFITNYRPHKNPPVITTPPKHAFEPHHSRPSPAPRPQHPRENRPQFPNPRPELTETSSSTSFRNIAYLNDGNRTERLDLFLPLTAAPASGYPVILAIHGGGWHRYSKEQFSPAVEPLTSEGFAVVAVNYQLATSRTPSWPMALTDLWQSVGWINRQSATYRLNPLQITALGTSAGGNLAMLLATGAGTPFGPTSLAASPQNLPKIQAAVSFFGPTELESCLAESRRGAGIAITRFLGGSVAELPDLYQAASPLGHVSKTTAPILLIHGTADDLIPVRQSEKMADALSKAGVMNQLIEVPGGIHAQIGYNLSYMNKSYAGEVVSFIKKALKLN